MSEEETQSTETETPEISGDDAMRAELAEKLNPKETADGQETNVEEESEHEEESEDGSGEESDSEESGDSEESNEVNTEGLTKKEVNVAKYLNKEEKEAFNTLDVKSKKTILRLVESNQKHFSKKTNEIGKDGRIGTIVRETFEPFQQELSMMGVDEGQAIKQLLAFYQNIQYKSKSDPEGFIKEYARELGVDLQKEDSDEGQKDPTIQKLEQQIKDLQGNLTQRDQMQVDNQVQELNQVIEDFKNATDSDGQPLYPDFDDHRIEMGQLMQNGMADSMESAYKKVKLMHGQPLKEPSKVKQVQKAKKASFNAKGSAVANKGASTAFKSFEDELKNRLSEAGLT